MSSSMEEHVPSTSNHSTNFSEETMSPNALVCIRSLIVNPSTPESTITSIFETLTRSLQLSTNKLVLRHILKLLYDLASHHCSLSRLVFDSVRSHSLLSSESARLAVEALDVLASISEHDGAALVPAMDELDDGFFASLCFSPSGSLRPWLLTNAERLRVRPYLLFTVFLGFTKDPYPYVRKVALDGLVGLSKNGVIEDRGMIRGCYFRAVELLTDMEDCVRSAAVRAVCAWGLMLVASNPETKVYCSDEVFVKLCSMARDMSMEVRVEAFNGLGKIEMVSEDILLQTLSKKVLGTAKENICYGQYHAEQFAKLASSAAGALVHGLEDEFHEVRTSACHSLRTLTILSAKFSVEVLSLLMDVLNDDSMVVRLQALGTIHHMATFDCLEVQETHMHMLLGSLVDKNLTIRSATRKILKLAKLPVFKLFKLTVDALLENLETYPQDEADAFSILFHIGRNHGKFVLCIIEEISQQIEPTSESKLRFDSIRVAGLLVLAISAPLLHGCNIPPTIFAYTVTFLGRISHALRDVMSENSLLAYLSQQSRSTGLSAVEFSEGQPYLRSSKSDVLDYSSNEKFGSFPKELQEKGDGTSKMQSPIMESRKLATSLVEYQLEVHDEVINSMNAILAKVKDIWPFVQSGHVNGVLRTLRSCKEELATFTSEALAPAGVLTFTLQYLKAIELLVKVWEQFLPPKYLHSSRMGTLDLLFGNLDRRLRELRTRFVGLSKEEELHILELIFVTCVLKLSKVEICCKLGTLRKLSSTISQVESLLKEGSIEPSNFVVEVGNLSSEIHSSMVDGSSNPFLFKRLLEFFSLKKFVFCGALKHIKAEIDVPDNNFENPISFVSGLPVGIPCQITLHNILEESRLWLKLRMDDESTQFVFLDSSLFRGCHEVRRFTFVAPFYRTPKSISFTVSVCIGVECLYEDVQFVKRCWGPKHELTYLCQEKEAYFSMVG